jgi:MFS family permease
MRSRYSVLYSGVAYYGWLVVAVVFLSSALSIGPGYAFGLFIEPLEDSFGWHRTAISLSLSFGAVGSLTSPLLGRIMDRYGTRPLMAGSLAVMGVGFLLRPLMTELWHWYALSFLQYVAFSGAAGLPVGRLVGVWFRSSRGRVMGVATTGNNFGGLTVPLMTGFLLASGNWQAAYLLLGSLAFVIAFLSLALIREHPPEAARASPDTPKTPTPALTGWTVRDAVHSRSFYALAISLTLGSFTYSGVVPQVADHLIVEGMSRTTVPFAISLLAAFGMVGKLSFGYLSERYTARRMMMASLSGQVVFIALMVAFPTPPIAWMAVPLFGLFMGSYGALVNLVVQDSFGLRNFGTISGLIMMTSVVSFFAGPILAGRSYDLTGHYGVGFIVVAVMFAVAVVALTRVDAPTDQ